MKRPPDPPKGKENVESDNKVQSTVPVVEQPLAIMNKTNSQLLSAVTVESSIIPILRTERAPKTAPHCVLKNTSKKDLTAIQWTPPTVGKSRRTLESFNV